MATKAQVRDHRQVRNAAPHKAARLAVFRWPNSALRFGGATEFWDSLTAQEKELCRDMVKRIEEAPEEER